MRKYKFLINKILCITIALFICAIPLFPKFIKTNKSEAAVSYVPENDPRTISTRSTFIHTPTYSIIYHNSVYFFDEYDNKVKKYNIGDTIEETSIDITSFGYVIDIDYIDEYVYVLSKTIDEQDNQTEILKLSIIDLSDFSIEKTIIIEDISTKYKNLSICEFDNDFLISLTPDNNTESISPIILTLNKTSLEITNKCYLEIDESILSLLFKNQIPTNSNNMTTIKPKQI